MASPPKSLGSTVSDGDGWFDYPEGLPLKDRFYVYVSAEGFLERVFQANIGEAYVLENGTRKLDTFALRRPVTVVERIRRRYTSNWWTAAQAWRWYHG